MSAIYQKSWDEVVISLVNSGAVPSKVHRVLLYGNPGTGKSSIACHLFPSVERVALFPSQPIEDLLGCMSGMSSDGAGGMQSQWVHGPGPRAMVAGVPLIIDEIDQVSADCRTALHALLDDAAICRITLPSGEVVKPSAGYCVFATSNVHPSRLPAALLDRFDIVLRADSPSAGALGAIKNAGLRAVAGRMIADGGKELQDYRREVGVRSSIAADRLSGPLGIHDACCLIFGESDGKRISEAVVSQV